MKVISLFDGIATGRLALEQLGFQNIEYEAYEIEDFPIKVAKKNFPDIIEKGDVFKTEYREGYDLLIGGSPCFAAGTMVITKDGIKPIETIKIGDEVLTHQGRFRKVTNTMSHKAEKYCVVKAEGTERIVCTPNHRFYTGIKERGKIISKNNWTAVEDFKKYTNPYKRLVLTSIFDDLKKKYNYSGTVLKQNQFCGHEVNTLPLDNEYFWRIVGRYIGDGWIKYKYKNNKKLLSGIIICENKKMSTFRRRVK